MVALGEAKDSHTMTNKNVDKIYVSQCFENKSPLCHEAGFPEKYQNKTLVWRQSGSLIVLS